MVVVIVEMVEEADITKVVVVMVIKDMEINMEIVVIITTMHRPNALFCGISKVKNKFNFN